MAPGGVFTIGEDTLTLRLKSELFDLRVGYANPATFVAVFAPTDCTKAKGTLVEWSREGYSP